MAAFSQPRIPYCEAALRGAGEPSPAGGVGGTPPLFAPALKPFAKSPRKSRTPACSPTEPLLSRIKIQTKNRNGAKARRRTQRKSEVAGIGHQVGVPLPLPGARGFGTTPTIVLQTSSLLPRSMPTSPNGLSPIFPRLTIEPAMVTATITRTDASPLTMADLLTQLGDIPPSRVRLRPLPGAATEQDVLQLHDRENLLFELVDGVLVEKAMGFREALVAVALLGHLARFVAEKNLGLVVGPDGMLRLFLKTVRIPDVAYISWRQIPTGRVPSVPIPDLFPDLAVEILSASNTPAEMARKRREYFAAGARLVWIIDLELRTVAVYTSADEFTVLSASHRIDGGDVLQGFTLELSELFSELDRHS